MLAGVYQFLKLDLLEISTLVPCSLSTAYYRRDCSIVVAKPKTLISYTFTAQSICIFIFAYAKIRFSHDAAHL